MKKLLLALILLGVAAGGEVYLPLVARAGEAPDVYLSEVAFNPPNISGVSESRLEWVEVCSASGGVLEDAFLSDGAKATPLPPVAFTEGECVLFVASEFFYELGYTLPEGVQVHIVGTIGSRGLRNSGETLFLTVDGLIVDQIGWCEAGELCPPEGQTLQRVGEAWVAGDPTPGRPYEGPGPTPTPTPEITPEPGTPPPSGFWLYCEERDGRLVCEEREPVCER